MMSVAKRRTLAMIAAAAAMTAAMAASAPEAASQSQTVRNVVLVHGAFADGSG